MPTHGVCRQSGAVWQTDDPHTWLAVHARPQPPQWRGSPVVSTHSVPHSARPIGQTKPPPAPALPPPPALPPAPPAPALPVAPPPAPEPPPPPPPGPELEQAQKRITTADANRLRERMRH